MVRSIFHQGVQTTRGSIILPGGPNFVIIPTRGSAGRFYFATKTTFFGPPGHQGVQWNFFLTQNQPFFGSPGCREPDRFFIFLPIAGGEIRFCNWFVAFLNSKV